MPILSEDIVAAEVKYINNPDLITQNIKQLRIWLPTQAHLPEISDEMLLRIHHSCYYDFETTKTCIENYYTMRTNLPELFTNRDVNSTELANFLEVMNLAVLPEPDPRGYHVIYSGLCNYEPSRFLYVEANKLIFMAMDMCAHQHGLVQGVVHIHDMKGAKLGHLARCSLSWIRKCINYNQDAHPIRSKEVHVVNVVPWVDKILMLVKPLMKKETRNLLHFHSSNSETLFDSVPKKNLPEDLGGSLPSIEVLKAETVQQLASLRGFFEEEEKSRVNETKREKGNRRETKTEDMFDRLEID